VVEFSTASARAERAWFPEGEAGGRVFRLFIGVFVPSGLLGEPEVKKRSGGRSLIIWSTKFIPSIT